MHSLATLQRLNNQFEVAKSRRRAIAMNKPSGHAKDAEKGREKPWLKEVLADAKAEKKKWPKWALKKEVALVDTDYDCPDTLTGVYSAEDLRDLGVRS